MARLIASGMVKELKILQWTIRSQGPKESYLDFMGQVQRLDGGRSLDRMSLHILITWGLRYSPASSENLQDLVYPMKREPAA